MNLYYTLSVKPLLCEEQRTAALKLLDYALKREFQADLQSFEIRKGEYGKPYFVNSPVCFNYSHCKYGAVCVVSTVEVGVDIQEIKPTKPAVVKRVCCDNELNELEGINSDEAFIRMWTLKEAYSKFTGKGFAEGFNSIDTTDAERFPQGLSFKKDNVYIAYYTANPVTLQSVQVLPL